MTKKEQLNLISMAIENLQRVANDLEKSKGNPTVDRQYNVTIGQIDAYRACFHLLNGSAVSIKLDI